MRWTIPSSPDCSDPVPPRIDAPAPRKAGAFVLQKPGFRYFPEKERIMIYWPLTPGTSFTLAFPNTAPGEALEWEEGAWLELENNVSLLKFGGYIDFDQMDKEFCFCYWTNPDDLDPADYPPQGEYTYTLRRGEDGPVVSKGIMILGAYDADRTEYEQTIQYEQYN